MKTHLITLKNLIESNKKPIIFNCSSGPGYTLGDIEDIGWMTERYTHDSEGEVDGWERDYYGPNSFMLETYGSTQLEEIKKGDTIY
jgi:hypothetical protein